MKTYIDFNTTIFSEEYGSIPKSTENRYYLQFLTEIQNGKAELVPYIFPDSIVSLITWDDITSKREQLLRDSDYRVLPDANPETKDLWIAYREMLRIITDIFSTPESVIWPIPPEL